MNFKTTVNNNHLEINTMGKTTSLLIFIKTVNFYNVSQNSDVKKISYIFCNGCL